MGKIVMAAAASHAPHITGFPDRASSPARERFYGAMAEIGAKLRAAEPDLLVVVASDHFSNLSPQCMPAFCVGNGESFSGPVEQWIRIDPFTVDGHPGFAQSLLRHAFAHGFEPAFAPRIALEHGVAVPLSFLTPDFDIPILPILQNCMVPPLPTLQRCHAFGTLIREAAHASDLRVAVIGTGGLSHSPGAPESGVIDEAFDRDFLQSISSGEPRRILDIPNTRLDAAGFGAWEIRQWATALGAADDAPARILAYEPIVGWETGCAAALFETSAA